jgi:hypothetical protein
MLAVRRDSQERALAVQRQPRGGASLARNRDGVARKCVRGGAFARQFQAGVCTWWRKKATLLANEGRTLRTAERFSVSNAQGIDVRTRTSCIAWFPSRPASSDRAPPARSRDAVHGRLPSPIRPARPPGPRKKNQAARGRGSASATWTATSQARSISRMASGGGRSVNRSCTSRIEPRRTMALRPNLV